MRKGFETEMRLSCSALLRASSESLQHVFSQKEITKYKTMIDLGMFLIMT